MVLFLNQLCSKGYMKDQWRLQFSEANSSPSVIHPDSIDSNRLLRLAFQTLNPTVYQPYHSKMLSIDAALCMSFVTILSSTGNHSFRGCRSFRFCGFRIMHISTWAALNFETVITPTMAQDCCQRQWSANTFGSRCEAKKTASCHTCFVEPRVMSPTRDYCCCWLVESAAAGLGWLRRRCLQQRRRLWPAQMRWWETCWMMGRKEGWPRVWRIGPLTRAVDPREGC